MIEATVITITFICAVILAYVKGREHAAKEILRAIDRAEFNQESDPNDLNELVSKLIKYMK